MDNVGDDGQARASQQSAGHARDARPRRAGPGDELDVGARGAPERELGPVAALGVVDPLDVRVADDDITALDAEDCFQQLVEESLEGEEAERFEFGEVDVGQLSIAEPAVEEFAAWQVAVPVEITSGAGDGLSPSIFLEWVIMREGDAVAFVQTNDVLTQFDPALRATLVEAVAGRMTEPGT